jgi:hypothetical protein
VDRGGRARAVRERDDPGYRGRVRRLFGAGAAVLLRTGWRVPAGVLATLRRSTFAAFGSIGLLSTLCYWAEKAFWDSAAFPFALAAVALGFVGLGIFWHARADAWATAVRTRIGRARF